MTNETTSPLDESVRVMRERIGSPVPRIAVVLGSGLGGLADAVDRDVAVPYAELPDHPRTTVEGHRGEWIAGRLDGVPVLLQAGRFHLYEGHEPRTILLPVRLMARLGVTTLLLTNAAGCLRPRWRPPALMLVADHVALSFRSPLRGPLETGEARFPDLSDPYDEPLRAIARGIARDRGIRLHEGVYAGLLGPSYETPAEIRMLDRLGVDAVGMSTVPECLAAKALGLRVLAISTLTNLAAGISPTRLDHAEVLEAGASVRASLETLVRGIVAAIAAADSPTGSARDDSRPGQGA